MALLDFLKKKKDTSAAAKAKAGKKESVTLILPETFMNKSGEALKKLITSVKKADDLIVIYDDLDLGIGTLKISYNRSAGGHKGLQSIIKAIKTEAFTRLRIGVSPTTASGKVKRPGGSEEAIIDFILGKFKKAELETLKKIGKTAGEALETIINDGREMAMGKFN